jgi:hypothetical protein
MFIVIQMPQNGTSSVPKLNIKFLSTPHQDYLQKQNLLSKFECSMQKIHLIYVDYKCPNIFEFQG